MDENIPVPPSTDAANILITLIVAIIVIIPFWRIFSKAGYSGWLSLLMIFPLVNLILLYFLGFSHWPILRVKEEQLVTNKNIPPPPTA